MRPKCEMCLGCLSTYYESEEWRYLLLSVFIYKYMFIYLFTSVWVWEGMSEITDFIELRVLVEAGGHSLSRNSGNKT